MSGFVGSAHDAVGQLQAEVQRLRDDNARLIRALQKNVAARDDPHRLEQAIGEAETGITRSLKGA